MVDVATPPERRSKPHRAYIAAGVAAAVFVLLIPFVLLMNYRRERLAAGNAKAGRADGEEGPHVSRA